MDIVDLIKREHAKTSNLFEKLADTSEGAVKTRERLVAQLTTGLEAHLRIVQEHVYPLLRKNEETRELVPELKGRNELKRQLAELERTPKDDEGFLTKLKELKKTVEQHLRAEQKQIFPAIKKAIGGEEAEELAKRIAAETREELQGARQQQAEEVADDAAEAVKRTAEVVSLGTQRTLEEIGETAQEATKAAAAESRRLAESATEQARRAGRNVLNAAEIYTETGQRAAADLRALMTAPTAAVSTFQAVQRAWLDWLGQAAQANTRAAQALWRCSSLQQVAEVQRGALTENLHIWLEGGARVLRSARQASDELLRPIEERIDQVQRDDRRKTSSARRTEAA